MSYKEQIDSMSTIEVIDELCNRAESILDRQELTEVEWEETREKAVTALVKLNEAFPKEEEKSEAPSEETKSVEFVRENSLQ